MAKELRQSYFFIDFFEGGVGGTIASHLPKKLLNAFHDFGGGAKPPLPPISQKKHGNNNVCNDLGGGAEASVTSHQPKKL